MPRNLCKLAATLPLRVKKNTNPIRGDNVDFMGTDGDIAKLAIVSCTICSAQGGGSGVEKGVPGGLGTGTWMDSHQFGV